MYTPKYNQSDHKMLPIIMFSGLTGSGQTIGVFLPGKSHLSSSVAYASFCRTGASLNFSVQFGLFIGVFLDSLKFGH